MFHSTDVLLTEKQAAQLLNVSVSTIQKGRTYGYGPPYLRIGRGRGAIRYCPVAIEAYKQKNTINPGKANGVKESNPFHCQGSAQDCSPRKGRNQRLGVVTRPASSADQSTSDVMTSTGSLGSRGIRDLQSNVES
jgi:Helix-turn-helix domain